MAKVHFRTNVLLKSIIGKDLITDDNIAVLELVKNSFDAGSEKVRIEFKNLITNSDEEVIDTPDENSSKLIISDLGAGMASFDLTNKWLNIAYSEKKQKREEYGRVLAGNKGVGRFSCDRLGKFLTIYSKKIGSDYIKIFIDWRWFEKESEIDLTIQDIELNLIEIPETEFKSTTNIAPFEHGTILEISQLREAWSYNKILTLKRQLERLINPNQSFKSSAFEILIDVGEYIPFETGKQEYEKVNGKVKNRIFDNLNFRTTSIHSRISDDGKIITTKLQDRGNDIFELKEHNRFSLLKDIGIFIYYLNPYSKAYFTKQTGIRSVDFGSIFLFINGFRIPPYGDEGDDWLGLEIRKGQGYNRYLGTREIVGRIEIKDEEDRFRIISSRSGVVNSESFQQLTRDEAPFGFFYKTFRRLERFVVEGIKWDATDKDEKKLEKEILNDPNWNESKESYLEDPLTRNIRIIEVVRNIIDSKKDEFLNLKIYEDFILLLIDEQTKKTKRELEYIAEQLKGKNLSYEEVADFLKKIDFSRGELSSFSTIIDPYYSSTSSLESVLKELENKYTDLKLEKERIELRLKAEEDARIQAENAKEKAEAEKKEAVANLEIEIKKNTYLLATRRTISNDADGLIHNIKLNSTNIISYVNLLTHELKEGDLNKAKMLSFLANILVEAEKCLTISKIITRADIQDEIHDRPINIPKYIEQYCEHYNEIFDRKLSSHVINNSPDFFVITNILDLSLVFDNLFSNAQKWNATEILIEIQELTGGVLSIIINDNGDGLSDKFTKKPQAIFELGVNDTSPISLGYGGSGIGLNTVKTILRQKSKSLKGDISFLCNGYKLKGAAFTITLKNKYSNAKLSNNR